MPEFKLPFTCTRCGEVLEKMAAVHRHDSDRCWRNLRDRLSKLEELAEEQANIIDSLADRLYSLESPEVS